MGAVGGVRAITFDFGNTLAPVGRAALRQVVERTADAVCGRWADLDRAEFLATWDEERERQFREEVPRFREVDLAQRLVRIIARLRGAMAAPGPDERWDDARAATLIDPADIAWAVDAYSAAFVDGLPPAPGVHGLLVRLAATRDLAILSNWPLAATIDRYADAHGWTPHLRAIVVSQRVGTIKPHPAIFAAARSALGDPDPNAILHVGDDWAADVVGAATAGWRTAWLPDRPADSPLPTSERDDSVRPDIVLGAITELEAALAAPAGSR
ncbi:MAG TPA: HAD family hydrolase [Candidatus Limnocylindrales bacterium]|nr:HAD family hydrolase [Candidatus Limnocylindrales bacterium]